MVALILISSMLSSLSYCIVSSYMIPTVNLMYSVNIVIWFAKLEPIMEYNL